MGRSNTRRFGSARSWVLYGKTRHGFASLLLEYISDCSFCEDPTMRTPSSHVTPTAKHRLKQWKYKGRGAWGASKHDFFCLHTNELSSSISGDHHGKRKHLRDLAHFVDLYELGGWTKWVKCSHLPCVLSLIPPETAECRPL